MEATLTSNAINQICNCYPHWVYKQSEYLCIADIGSDITDWIRNNENIDIVKDVFSTIEKLFEIENQEINSLLIAGMFNRMQNEVYRTFEKPDVIELFMGKKSLKAWGDYLEGHLGKGFRTIIDWRKILIQTGGGLQKLSIRFANTDKEIILNDSDLQKIRILPLLAEKTIDWIKRKEKPYYGFKKPYACIITESWYYPDQIFNQTIIIGNRVNQSTSSRYVKTKNQIGILNMKDLELKLKKIV
ncbi:MAG: hypothetical protein SFU98_06345 [Leptospiraceae bacterium]|nr:hypothetical protein [Leptospiraceae bacterium]